MTTKNHFAVYEHIRPDTGQVFYVGKGCPSRVRNHKRDKNRHHINILKRLARLGLKMEVSIVAANLPEDSANTLEKMRILMWRAAKVPIVNLTEGGEGVSGRKMSEDELARMCAMRNTPEFKEAASTWMQGNKNGHGRIVTEEVRQVISAKLKGRTFSVESIAKMTAAQRKPETVAKKRAASKIAQNSPEVKAKKRAAMLIVANSEEVRTKKRAAMLIIANDPDVKARKSAAMKATLARKRAEKAQAA